MPQEDNLLENNRSNVGYWQKWIKGAKKASKIHWDDSLAAWKEYENPRADSAEVVNNQKKLSRSYPIYQSSCKILEPAYYSKTPRFKSRREFDTEDEIALTASVISDRFIKYLVDNSNFDEGMEGAVKEFIHSDKASLQCIFTVETLSPDEATDVEIQEINPTIKKITISSLTFDEVLHSPEAKSESEIMEKAYYFCLSYEEAIKKFDKADLPWKNNKNYDRENDDVDRKDIPGKYLEGWEIHCKHTKMVYWVSEDSQDEFLKPPEPDIYDLRNFFPSTPFIISNKPRKSLYPTPAFIHLQKTLCQLHDQYNKTFELIDGIRRRAIVAGDEDLIRALESLDQGEFVAAKNIQAIIDKGGVEKLIYYLPVQELVSAISELGALEDRFKENVYEWFGVPDILRGSSDPLETAKAQEIAQTSAHDRFKYQKRQVKRMALDAANLMFDMGLKVYTPEEIARICGYDYLEPEHQQRFFPALELLKNDEERIIRLDIEEESMSFLDERWDSQRKQSIADAVMQGLGNISKIPDPSYMGISLKLLLKTVSSLGGSKEYEEDLKSIVTELEEAQANPPPPPPDYEQMKLEIQQNKVQLDAEAKARELDQKEFKLQLDGQKQADEAGANNADIQIKGFMAQLEKQAQDFSMVVEGQKLQLENQRIQLDGFRAQIEAFVAKVGAQEAALEELRLAKEQQDLEMEKRAESREESPPPAPQIISLPPMDMPPINIHVSTLKPGVKKGRITRDEFGNSELTVEELPQ